MSSIRDDNNFDKQVNHNLALAKYEQEEHDALYKDPDWEPTDPKLSALKLARRLEKHLYDENDHWIQRYPGQVHEELWLCMNLLRYFAIKYKSEDKIE